ncbi:MAG: hypothetical protein OEY36_10635 [Gammaproteobacteria bacterium]|nr:hypothetical protein [Gammaproteobacteria bacterium]
MKNNTYNIKLSLLLTVLLLNLSACSMFNKLDTTKIANTLEDRPSHFSSITDSEGSAGRTVIRYKTPARPDIKTKTSLLKRLQQGFNREIGKKRKVVDRKLSKSVGNEIELAEIYGKQSGRQDADYIMMIALDDYHENQSSVDEKSPFDNKKYSNCYFDSRYQGWIRVLSLPSLERVAQWEIDDSNSGSYKQSNSKRCRQDFNSHLQRAHTKMINETICNSEKEYLNALAPSGHLLSIKRRKDSVILETSLGSRHKAKKGDKIYFYHELNSEHYAEGSIISISSERSQVKLETMDSKETLYRFDWVRPHYSGIMDMMKCIF